MTGSFGGHLTDDLTDDGHRITAVGHTGAPLARGLRGGAVDDGDEVICDDDSVLAFLLRILRYETLFDDFHL